MKFAAILFVLVAVADAQRDPNKFCFECLGKRNHKDLYSNPDDCHTYFQCRYNGDGTAEGILRDCPEGTFWHDDTLVCAPEGTVPCVDRCKEDAISKRGCYGTATSCSSFYICSNGITSPFCCPPKTQFNEETCTCLESETCSDPCTLEGPAVPTTKQPPQVFDTFCIDSFGVTLRPGSSSATFLLVDRDDATVTTEKRCALGTQFSLSDCACSIPVDIGAQSDKSKQCTAYFAFDGNNNDLSLYKFVGDIVPPSELSTAAAAHGSGSLRNKGPDGRIEMPFTKIGMIGDMSFCFFFRCAQPPCTYGNAGLISDRGCAECEKNQLFVVSLVANNTIRATVQCDILQEPVVVGGPFSANPNEFVQLCLIKSTKKYTSYLNGEKRNEIDSPCEKLSSQCPMGIGHDIEDGAFDGFIDEMMLCPYNIGPEGVKAHLQGQDAVRAAGMIP